MRWGKNNTKNYAYAVFTSIGMHNQFFLNSDECYTTFKSRLWKVSAWLSLSLRHEPLHLWGSHATILERLWGRPHRDGARCPRGPSCEGWQWERPDITASLSKNRHYLRWDRLCQCLVNPLICYLFLLVHLFKIYSVMCWDQSLENLKWKVKKTKTEDLQNIGRKKKHLFCFIKI